MTRDAINLAQTAFWSAELWTLFRTNRFQVLLRGETNGYLLMGHRWACQPPRSCRRRRRRREAVAAPAPSPRLVFELFPRESGDVFRQTVHLFEHSWQHPLEGFQSHVRHVSVHTAVWVGQSKLPPVTCSVHSLGTEPFTNMFLLTFAAHGADEVPF